jgi:uncharacterized sulfatase
MSRIAPVGLLLPSIWIAALLSAVHARAADAPPPPKPNILFLLIDDMGYSDFSCFGGTRAKTTEIDRIAAEGIPFTQFYVNAPICSPSRVAFTTGQYPNRWRITSYLDTRADNERRHLAQWLAPQAPSLARFLHDAGYYTAHVGKWHMGGQRDVADAPAITSYGFDTSVTNFEGLGPRILGRFDPVNGGKPFNHTPTEMSAKFGTGAITWVERWRVTETYCDRALAAIEAAQKAGKPFYINLWPDDVHSPCQAPPNLRGDGSPAANYVGVLTELDRQVGRVFERIRSDPALRDNTIILIASDNGPEKGLGESDGLRGSKGQLYDGGIRLPLIAWCPGRIARRHTGTTNDITLIAGIDVAPSILALAGIAPPTGVAFDGQDMSATMMGRSREPRDHPVLWVRPPDRPGPNNSFPDLAIRDGKWKLLVHRDGSGVELFDMTADPGEKTNLASMNAELAQRLKTQVIAWDRSIEAPK